MQYKDEENGHQFLLGRSIENSKVEGICSRTKHCPVMVIFLGSRMDYIYIGDYGKVACGWDMHYAKLSNGIARINSYGIYYDLDFDRVGSR